ncbi:hypothetical protein HZH66_002010 [Vespula vulgaris]|uniref:Uncharacterized protein n=1 Tax=Vespula vulgaris TaxID=7454 RepID=A0A834KIR1_VESVU|nr:hypothetical protein HZH66_002010 [Vespula vulgaris]
MKASRHAANSSSYQTAKGSGMADGTPRHFLIPPPTRESNGEGAREEVHCNLGRRKSFTISAMIGWRSNKKRRSLNSGFRLSAIQPYIGERTSYKRDLPDTPQRSRCQSSSTFARFIDQNERIRKKYSIKILIVIHRTCKIFEHKHAKSLDVVIITSLSTLSAFEEQDYRLTSLDEANLRELNDVTFKTIDSLHGGSTDDINSFLSNLASRSNKDADAFSK